MLLSPCHLNRTVRSVSLADFACTFLLLLWTFFRLGFSGWIIFPWIFFRLFLPNIDSVVAVVTGDWRVRAGLDDPPLGRYRPAGLNTAEKRVGTGSTTPNPPKNLFTETQQVP